MNDLSTFVDDLNLMLARIEKLNREPNKIPAKLRALRKATRQFEHVLYEHDD